MTDATIVSAPPLSEARRERVAIPFALCTLIWSSTWLAIRGQLGTAPAAWSVTWRFLIAAVAMVAVAAAMRQRLRLTRGEHALAIGYGVTQYCCNYMAVYLAERTVTSGLVAVLFAILVVPNALLGWLMLGQAVSRPFAIGSGIALAGMALLFAHEAARADAGTAALLTGIGWSLAGVLFSSVANVLQGSRRAAAMPTATLVAWGMIWGTVANAAIALIVDGAPVLPADPRYWLGTLYLALFGSALAFSFYARVIRTIGPGRAAYTSVLSPALAMVLSTMFEGYRWSWQAAVGALLGLGGLAVALRARQTSAKAPSAARTARNPAR